MHTWILKEECVATYIAPIKQKKMHLLNTVSVCGIIWRPVGDTRINRRSILSTERNRFSLVYTWSALKSWNQQHQGWYFFHGYITQFEKKYFLAFIELKETYINQSINQSWIYIAHKRKASNIICIVPHRTNISASVTVTERKKQNTEKSK